MSRRKVQKQTQGNSRMMSIIIAIAVLAVAAFFIRMQMQSGSVSGLTALQRIAPQQYQADFMAPARPHFLVDVRTPAEFAGGHIEGAVNIPLDSLAQRLDEIPQDQPVVVYCRSGNRSATAARQLAQAGYTDIYDLGGIIAWQNQGLALQTPR